MLGELQKNLNLSQPSSYEQQLQEQQSRRRLSVTATTLTSPGKVVPAQRYSRAQQVGSVVIGGGAPHQFRLKGQSESKQALTHSRVTTQSTHEAKQHSIIMQSKQLIRELTGGGQAILRLHQLNAEGLQPHRTLQSRRLG